MFFPGGQNKGPLEDHRRPQKSSKALSGSLKHLSSLVKKSALNSLLLLLLPEEGDEPLRLTGRSERGLSWYLHSSQPRASLIATTVTIS